MAVKRWNGTAWEVYAGADLAPVKVTDGRVGKTTFIGATSPTGQVDGDIWIDQDTTTNAVVPTALTTKGDIFAATGNAAYSRLAAGNNGESLFADSSTSTGLRWQGDFNTGKNKIINGDFSIWQRGTSFLGSTESFVGFTADRWYANSSDVTRENFAPGNAIAGYEPQYFLKAKNRTGQTAGRFDRIEYKVEDVRTFAGQTVTFSFWTKKPANKTGIMGINIIQDFGTGGSTRVFNPFVGVTYSGTGWERKSFTMTLASIAGKTIGPASFISFEFYGNMGGTPDYEFDIWGFQLEAGSVATPFTTNTGNQQAELAACQRYYWQGGGFQQAGGTSPASTETSVFIPINTFNAVPMRATPTPFITGTSYITDFNSNLRTITSVAMLQTSAIRINYDSTKLTSGLSYGVNFTGAGAALILSAEL
jgi:hypothetical protein